MTINMPDKQAIDTLLNLLKKYPLTEEEKEAIRTALGVLAWTKLIENKREARKNREKENE